MRHWAAFIVHECKPFPPASHSRAESISREWCLRSMSWKHGTCRALGIKLTVPTETLGCGDIPSALYHRPLPTRHGISLISHLATSVTANGFYFHDNLHQVCRPANGHKYSTSFLKLDLDFGSNSRAPKLVKHSIPAPKLAQHSCFSSSYPFNLIPCTALLALWLLCHSLESTEWKGVFQGWDLPHQKPGPWMSTGTFLVCSCFIFIYL